MKLNKLFHSFKQKMIWENMLKSLLLAAMLAACGVFITSFVYHILIMETPVILTALIGGGIFLISFLTAFFIRYPTQKRVAVRVDAMGLKERATTMLEFQDVNTEIAQLQRMDAVTHIQKASPKQMVLRIKKAEYLLCIVSICLAFTMLVLPFNVFAFSQTETTTDDEQQEIIRQLIANLREDVKQAELEEQLKEQLNQIIDDLEEDLQDAESELDQAGEIQQAIDQMKELLEEALTKYKIGEALQKYELTRKLGEAISAGNAEKVSSALDELESELISNTGLVKQLSETITSALADSGVAEDDALYTALADLSSTLILLDITGDSFVTNLGALFDDAEAAILAALEQQAAIEEQIGELEDSMNEAKDDVLGNEKEEKPEDQPTGEGEKPEGEKPEGEMPEGERPEGEMPEGEMPEGMEGQMPGDGEGEGSTMTEGIYDPVSGNVTYGEVFAAYYAQYLEALESGEVPEDLQEIMDQYFSALG